MKKKVAKKPSHLGFIQSFLYVVGSIVLTLILVQLPFFQDFITAFGDWGYIGAIVAGMFFVSIFTAAPAALILVTLAQTQHPLLIAVFAGLGAVIGDYLIASTLLGRSRLSLPDQEGLMKTISLLRHTKYRFLLTVLGAVIIASPLPDELGLSLIGLSTIKRPYFLFLTFLLNTLGIFLLLSLVH